MKLFHFFYRVIEIKENSYLSAEFFDYDKISIKILAREDISYVSLFLEGTDHICSFVYIKGNNVLSFRRSNLTGNETSIETIVDYEDIDEDENYLILKYGKIVETSKILKELGTTMEYLHSFISESINRYERI